jgi:hypothetical protein
MSRTRLLLLLINVVGGIAVLGSYALGIATHPDPVQALWGQFPEAWRPLSTVSMLLAAAGYLTFGPYLLFRIDPATTRLAGGLAFGWLVLPFLLILGPSALWMSLTFRFAASGAAFDWMMVRVALALVGLGSLLLLWMLAGVRPRVHPRHWALSVAGAAAFLFQTGVLDALVWAGFYRG